MDRAGTKTSIESMLRLVGQNIKRWRWRLVSIAALVALSFVLHVLYAGSLESSSLQGKQQSVPLRTPYFDLMIIPEAGERILSAKELPPTALVQVGQTRQMAYQVVAKESEAAAGTKVSSAKGSFELLGLHENTVFFNIPEDQLQGRALADSGEMLLPQTLAQEMDVAIGETLRVYSWQSSTRQTGVLYRDFTVVGTYVDDFDLPPALARYEDVLDLLPQGEANRFLVNYVRSDAVNLATLINWLRTAYPRATFISARLPEEMGGDLMSQILQPGSGILMLITVFVSVGVLTIAMMTFLERRKEFAALKTIGISNRQLTAMLLLEYGLTELGGLLVAVVILLLLLPRLTWLSELPAASILRLIVRAIGNTIVALVVALFFPVLTARVASVNQLLFARRIPLRTRQVDHMERADGDLIYRERAENLRIVKLPPLEELQNLMLFKQVGEPVKRGEVVASCESWFGFVVEEWIARCDGEVSEMLPNGLIAISPSDPEEPFYPYPEHLIQAVRRHEFIIQRAREDAEGVVLDPSTFRGRAEIQLEVEDFRERFQRRYEAEDKELEQQRRERRLLQERREVSAREANRRFWRGAVVAVVSLGIIYYSLEQGAIYLRDREEAAGYSAVRISLMTLQDYIAASGTLQPNDSSEVYSRVAGQLAEVFVSQGDIVTKGQPLYRLHNPSLQIALDQALIDLAAAEFEYDRLRLMEEQSSDAWSEERLRAQALQNTYEAEQRKLDYLRIYAASTGTITDVFYRVGDAVTTNAALFGFHDYSKLSEADYQVRLLQARTRLEAARRELDKLSIKAKYDGVVTDISIYEGQRIASGEKLLTLRETDRAETASGSTAIKLRQAELELAAREEAVSKLNIVAPASGRLSSLQAKVGDTLSAGTALALLGEDEQLCITVQVPQSQIGSVSLKQKAKIQLHHNGAIYEGEVHEIAPSGVTNASTRAVTFAVTIIISNEGYLDAGMGATVEIAGAEASRPAIGGLRGTLQNTRNLRVIAETSGEIAELKVSNGDRVVAGEVIAVLQNDNVIMAQRRAEEDLNRLLSDAYTAACEASIAQVLVRPGEEVKSGQELLTLRNTGIEAAYAQALRDYEILQQRSAGNTEIRTKAAGTISKIYVQAGDYVEQGELLAEMAQENQQYLTQRALDEAKKADAATQAVLLNPGARATEQARVKMEQAKRVVEGYQKAVDNLLIVAPLSGTVELRYAARVGTTLAADTRLASILDLSSLKLVAGVDETDIVNLQEGMLAEVEMSAFEYEIFAAKVTNISPVGTAVMGNSKYPVTFELDPSEKLRVGMSATAYVVLREVENTIAVSRDAVHRYQQGDTVVATVQRLVGGALVETEVSTGVETKTMVEILRGLREGDVVVIEKLE